MPEIPHLSRENFNSTERSRNLRDICIQILRRAKELLLNEDIADNADVRMRLHSELEHLGGQLLALGITEGMHTKEPHPDFSTPVILAEQLAGQVILLSASDLPSRSHTMSIVQEFSETKNIVGDMRTDVLDPKMPRQIQEFNDANIHLNVDARLFDADEEVFGEEVDTD